MRLATTKIKCSTFFFLHEIVWLCSEEIIFFQILCKNKVESQKSIVEYLGWCFFHNSINKNLEY